MDKSMKRRVGDKTVHVCVKKNRGGRGREDADEAPHTGSVRSWREEDEEAETCLLLRVEKRRRSTP